MARGGLEGYSSPRFLAVLCCLVCPDVSELLYLGPIPVTTPPSPS